MGLGGDLLLSASIAEYNNYTGFKIALVAKPRLSDLLCGRLFRSLEGVSQSPVFKGNPHIHISEHHNRSRTSRIISSIDDLFQKLLSVSGLQARFDEFLQVMCHKHACASGIRYLYKDDIRFSYAESVNDSRIIWRPEPNAVAATLAGFLEVERPDTRHPQIGSKFYQLEEEDNAVNALIERNKISPSSFLVIEPSTNTDWFSNLRAWPLDRWQQLIEHINATYPALQVIRIGLKDDSYLSGVIDLRGQTTFRQAASLIKKSKLFIGTEGGLMHAARAVEAKSVILWGGLTTPEFAGYPDSHMILTSKVSCSPCGLLGNCPYDVKCMTNIHISDTCTYIDLALTEYNAGIRYVP